MVSTLYRADASRITTRFLVIINAALLIACWDIAILRTSRSRRPLLAHDRCP